MQTVIELWSRSRIYRVVLIFTLAYLALRLLMQFVMMFAVPEWVGIDLFGSYIAAAEHFQQREDLYLDGSLEVLEEHYPYSPAFAMLFVPFLWLPDTAVLIIHTLLHCAAYILLYTSWSQVLRKLGLHTANVMLARSLPIWPLFSVFWDDLAYLNIYLPIALVATLLIEAVLDEHLGRAVLWLSVIAAIKPHWTFALAVPLLLGRWRFFGQVLWRAGMVYLITAAIVVVVSGPDYGIRQYVDYVRFLARLSRDFPWRGPEAGFLGYNHSIKQFVLYLLGVTPGALRVASLIRAVLLLPLAIVGLRFLRHPLRKAGAEVSSVGLDLAFALYLGAFICLDMVWEVSLGIVIFPYLLATLKQRSGRVLVCSVFLPYALLDPWRLISLALGQLDGAYVMTDPGIYIPLTMIVILTFYLLVGRLNRVFSVGAERRAVAEAL